LAYKFDDNFLLTSNFFKNRKIQVDYKNNANNFIKSSLSGSGSVSNSKILYNYNDFLEVNR